MALCRIRAVEQLKYESPGELGKLMGLDRVPEVRCLRQKLRQLSQAQDDKAPDIWAGLLSKDWMHDEPELAVSRGSAPQDVLAGWQAPVWVPYYTAATAA
jgi:hypothetical protein